MFFKRKKKEQEIKPKVKLDYSKYSMKITLKAILVYEHLYNTSFYLMKDDDSLKLMYAVFITNNNFQISFEVFLTMITNQKFASWIIKEYSNAMFLNTQMISKKEVDSFKEVEKPTNPEDTIKMTDIVKLLIVKYNINPHYVMNEMEIWEIGDLLDEGDRMDKDLWSRERLWTYYQILPHVDGNKLKSPEKLVTFPWEKESVKKKAEQGMKNNMYAIKHLIGSNIFGNTDGTE